MSGRRALAARPAGKAPPRPPPSLRILPRLAAGGPLRAERVMPPQGGQRPSLSGSLPAQPGHRGDGRLPLGLRTHPRHLLVDGERRIRSPKRNVRRRPLCAAALECRTAGDGGFSDADGQTVRWWRLSDPNRLCHMPSRAWAPVRPGKLEPQATLRASL